MSMKNKLICVLLLINALFFLVSCGKNHHGAGPKIIYEPDDQISSTDEEQEYIKSAEHL